MPRRIVLLGAYGYVGTLVASSLVRTKVRPVLAGRSAQSLAALGVTLGHGLDTAVVDLLQPESLLRLLRADDVVVNVAGPYVRSGRAAIEAAIQRRAIYLDCAIEPAHIRTVFEELGDVAAQAGVALVPGFGYEYAAGALAASLSLERAAAVAARVEVGYFATDPRHERLSVGTHAARAEAAMAPHFAWREGTLASTAFGDRVKAFDVDGVDGVGQSVGGSEHFTLPRSYPSVQEVGVYRGGPRSERSARRAGFMARCATRLPGFSALVRRAGALPRTPLGPDEEERARTGTVVVAVAYDSDGRELGRTSLAGVNRYTFTAEILTWAALRAASDGVRGEGALGPAQAFGLSGLREACAPLAATSFEPTVR